VSIQTELLTPALSSLGGEEREKKQREKPFSFRVYQGDRTRDRLSRSASPFWQEINLKALFPEAFSVSTSAAAH